MQNSICNVRCFLHTPAPTFFCRQGLTDARLASMTPDPPVPRTGITGLYHDALFKPRDSELVDGLHLRALNSLLPQKQRAIRTAVEEAA